MFGWSHHFFGCGFDLTGLWVEDVLNLGFHLTWGVGPFLNYALVLSIVVDVFNLGWDFLDSRFSIFRSLGADLDDMGLGFDAGNFFRFQLAVSCPILNRLTVLGGLGSIFTFLNFLDFKEWEVWIFLDFHLEWQCLSDIMGNFSSKVLVTDFNNMFDRCLGNGRAW